MKWVLILLLDLAIVALVVWLILRRIVPPISPAEDEDPFFAELVKRCAGDRAEAERLIEVERKLHGQHERRHLTEKALIRLEREA